jgi:SAM-dependent methyltransferase
MSTNSQLRLPADYVRNLQSVYFEDAHPTLVYQPDVYALADFLASRSGAKYVIDIGCGSGIKLRSFSAPATFVGIDHGSNLDRFSDNLQSKPHQILASDLNAGLPELPSEMLSEAVVICSDVIEHLQTPEHLLRSLSGIATQVKYLLLSTPARDRARGPADLGPPANKAHCQEWTLPEFLTLLSDYGIRSSLHGYTINTNFHRWKSTLLVLSGREAVVSASSAIDVTAIVKCYNDEDILHSTISHLRREGIRVHLVDNWSTDGSLDLIRAMSRQDPGITFERFPGSATTDYDWAALLDRTVQIAEERGHGWYLHYDSDELRCSPWRGVNLRDAIAHVDALGYTALDFTVIDFRYLEGDPLSADIVESMRYFEFGRRPGHFTQVKAWKFTGQNVSLSDSGGHDAQFSDRRVFPIKFLTRHYPLRGEAHAVRKIFEERVPRAQREKTQRGWHVQYDEFSRATLRGWQPHQLTPWHPVSFDTEFLVERISGIGII